VPIYIDFEEKARADIGYRVLPIIISQVILTISKGYLDLGGNIGGEGNWNGFFILISTI
jgi:hypothetical protein